MSKPSLKEFLNLLEIEMNNFYYDEDMCVISFSVANGDGPEIEELLNTKDISYTVLNQFSKSFFDIPANQFSDWDESKESEEFNAEEYVKVIQEDITKEFMEHKDDVMELIQPQQNIFSEMVNDCYDKPKISKIGLLSYLFSQKDIDFNFNTEYQQLNIIGGDEKLVKYLNDNNIKFTHCEAGTKDYHCYCTIEIELSQWD